MSRDDLRDRVGDMIAALQRAREFTGGMTLAEFAGDQKTLYAVIRALEIAGEAAKRVPETVRTAHPEIPWRSLAGMRDKLIPSTTAPSRALPSIINACTHLTQPQ